MNFCVFGPGGGGKQREEMKLGDEIAKMLPVAHSASGARCARSHLDFTLEDLNAAFSASAPGSTPPALSGD